jgi:hypothetical protein
VALRPIYVGNHFYLPGGVGSQSLQSATAHLAYMGNPQKEELVTEAMESAALHAKYMGERPGSAGYFGPDRQQRPDPEGLGEELRQHAGPVWRLIVSVTETDAVALGGALLTRPAWEAAVRRTMPRIAESMGLDPRNLRWAAAMHKKAGHPHVHLLFWEVPSSRIVGKWTAQELARSRQLWAQELYGPERHRLSQEKTAARDMLTGGVRQLLREPDASLGGGPRLSAAQAHELGALLGQVKEHLPPRGRLAYAYMPPNVKARIGQTVTWLLKNVPEFQRAEERFLAAHAKLARHYGDGRVETARERARQDLAERLASAVLRAAVDVDRRLDEVSASAAIWRAASSGRAGVPAGLLGWVDKIRTGQMTPAQAASLAIAAAPELQALWTQRAARTLRWRMPQDSLRSARRRAAHDRKALAGAPVSNLPRNTTPWASAKARHSQCETRGAGLWMPHAPPGSPAWSAWVPKVSGPALFEAQVVRVLERAAAQRARQLSQARAQMARRLVESLHWGLLATQRQVEAQAEYLAEQDAWARKAALWEEMPR